MSFLVYIAMLIAALVSVVMGLDVVTRAPPATKTAATPALVEPIRHASPVKPAATPRPTVAQQPARQTVSQSPDQDQNSDQAQASAPAEPARACNVQACEAAYQSFRASDCTYQPYDGPRRLCSK